MTADSDDRLALDLMMRGFMVSRLLRLVADHGVADRVPTEGGIAVGALAAAAGVGEAPLLRVMRALAAFGVFAVGADGMVSHSARSRLLRTDAPASLHHAARFWTAPGSWRAWEALDAALAGGVPHEAAWGTGRFAWLAAHPEEGRIFDAMMANFPGARHDAVTEAYDWSGLGLIADIGGGNGAALRRILARAPAARGLLFDRADVVAAIPREDLLDGRIEARAGDFREAVPPGADLYLLMRVLHDWDDAGCAAILGRCRAAMRAGARLLVVEQMLEPDPSRGPPLGYLSDLQMMAMFGAARERTEAEFAALLRAAGFAPLRVVPTRSNVAILEAEAA